MSPLPGTQILPIQFSGGLNSGVANFVLDQPYLDDAQNIVYNQIGQIDKRTGLTCISTNIQGGGNINAGFNITTFNNELCLFDGTNLYSYNKQNDTWINRGPAIATVNTQTRIINTKIATQSNPDCTSAANGISVYCWEDNRTIPLNSNGVRYSVINNNTNTSVLVDQLAWLSGSLPKVITDGYSQFYLCYQAAANTLLYNTIPVNNAFQVSSVANQIAVDGLVGADTVSIPYDAVIFNESGLDTLLVCYSAETGLKFNQQNFVLADGYGTINAVAMCLDSVGNIWVGFSNASDTYISCWNTVSGAFQAVLNPVSLNSLFPQPSVRIGMVEGLQAGSVNVTYEVPQSGNNNYFNNYTVDFQGNSNFIGQQRGLGLASKPFQYGNNIFINAVWQSSLQATYFTLCLTQGGSYQSAVAGEQQGIASAAATAFTVVSKHAPTNGGNYRSNPLLSQADTTDAGLTFLFAGQRKGPFTSYQNAQTANLGCAGYSVSFEDSDAFNNVSANNNLHLVGGIKKIYDGISCVEDNFNVFPELSDGYGCNMTLSTGGALSYNAETAPNLYQYLVVYEWTDNFGQVQRSGTSVANSISTTSIGQRANLTGPMLRFTDKVIPRSSVIISIYRTQLNLPIFYKITNDNAPLVNDITKDTWTFIDTQSDLDIGANENIYTNSQLANTAPPPCSLISLFQQRIMINNNEDPGVIWYSQNKFDESQYNTLALDFNTSFVEGVDSRLGNEITAIAVMDSYFVIFKETSIFIMQGDGPNALDTSGQFNDATLLVSDTGCNNQNSLVFITQTPNSPGGLMFNSNKGIYLFGRDESITYIGKPVERYNNLTITSANLLAQSNQVVFTTLEGTCLVYNYYFNAWSTWEGLPAVSATVWQDQLCILRPDGNVMIQDITNTVYVDTFPNNKVVPVKMLMTTPWLKFGGMQGYQSIYSGYLLGLLQGPHTLQIGVAYDNNPSTKKTTNIDSEVVDNRWASQPFWGALGTWGSNTFAGYQFQVNITNPRCQSIQLTFSDIDNPDETLQVGSPQYLQGSPGFSLVGLSFEVQAHASGFRLPANKKFGMGGK
jgi:hypothetical protein